MSGAGAPAVRPQHVEVRVEERARGSACSRCTQDTYPRVQPSGRDSRNSERCRESIKLAMVDETWTAKLYPSLKMLTEGRSSHARAVKDVKLQDATESTKDPVKRTRTR